MKSSVQRNRICSGGNIFHPFHNNSLGQNCGRRRSVSDRVIGLGGRFFHEFDSDVFKFIFQFNFLCDRHAILGNGRRPVSFVQHHISPLGTQGDFDGIGNNVHAAHQCFARVRIKFNLFCHTYLVVKLAELSELFISKEQARLPEK